VSILSNAISVFSSPPTTLAVCRLLSCRITATLSASATTWFVCYDVARGIDDEPGAERHHFYRGIAKSERLFEEPL
jgi:hypothetical protein